MLFFDIIEYSYPTTSDLQTTNEMATTMTSSQFDWRQFSEHIQRETGNQQAENTAATTYNDRDPIIGDYDDDDHQEPTFNKASANRTTTSNAERRHQQRHSPLRSTKPAIPATTDADADADVKPAHECVQKPKTRAERRANDAPLTETDVLPATTPAMKRERRSDYWVQRDDERRNAARTFKDQAQALGMDDE